MSSSRFRVSGRFGDYVRSSIPKYYRPSPWHRYLYYRSTFLLLTYLLYEVSIFDLFSILTEYINRRFSYPPQSLTPTLETLYYKDNRQTCNLMILSTWSFVSYVSTSYWGTFIYFRVYFLFPTPILGSTHILLLVSPSVFSLKDSQVSLCT